MPYRARRVLLVFAAHLDNHAALQKDIQHCEQRMRRMAILKRPLPAYFILMVVPHVPAYLHCTPEIQAYVKRNTEEALKCLEQIGTALGVPSERQSFAEGNRDLEACRVSKALHIDEVHGHTKGFVWLLTLWKNICAGWQGLFNKPSWPPIQKPRRQRPQRVVGARAHQLSKK